MIPLDYWKHRFTPKQRLAVAVTYIQQVMPGMVRQALRRKRGDAAGVYAQELIAMELGRLVDAHRAPKWPITRVDQASATPLAALVPADLWSWWIMASRADRAELMLQAYYFIHARFPEHRAALELKYSELMPGRDIWADVLAWRQTVDANRTVE